MKYVKHGSELGGAYMGAGTLAVFTIDLKEYPSLAVSTRGCH